METVHGDGARQPQVINHLQRLLHLCSIMPISSAGNKKSRMEWYGNVPNAFKLGAILDWA